MKRIAAITAAMLCALACTAQKSSSVNMEKSILVACYSATGTTMAKADAIAKATGATHCEITPAVKYTAADLDWRDKSSRSTLEMKDEASRPELGGKKVKASEYDIIFIGFPIWWDLCPRVVNTWIESQNLEGKVVIPFATSGGSTISGSVCDLRRLYPKVNWQDGKLLNCTDKEAAEWAQSMVKTDTKPIVYMTKDISPEGLVRIYEALGVEPKGKVAVKISTGEAGGHNYLKPELIKSLVAKVNGTIVECKTAYEGKRNTFEEHWETIREHGFTDIAPVELMDESGDLKIPVQNTKHLKYDIVGKGIEKYDFMVNLAHFKGHAMGGFGGVLKNQSIGVASSSGKAYIHTAGKTENVAELWSNLPEQDDFLESMADAAQAVHNYFGGRIIYIDVMNNLSVDCDCDAHPADPEMKDIGILASLDPVALDQACIDLVFNYPSTEGDDSAALIERVNSRHGIHILERAAETGLGSREYTLVSID